MDKEQIKKLKIDWQRVELKERHIAWLLDQMEQSKERDEALKLIEKILAIAVKAQKRRKW